MQNNSLEQRINQAIQGPVVDLVTRMQQENPQNKKLVVKIGELSQIKEMLKQSDLCGEPSENMDFVFSKVIDILHRQCLSEAKEFARI